jgi:hypothetical protein
MHVECGAGVAKLPAKLRTVSGIPNRSNDHSVVVSRVRGSLAALSPVTNLCAPGVVIDRSTLAFWVGKAAHELRPVHGGGPASQNIIQALHGRNASPVLDPGRGKSRRTILSNSPAMIACVERAGTTGRCCYAPGRSGKYATKCCGAGGILQVDGPCRIQPRA